MDRIKPTPTVTFRYDISSSVKLKQGSSAVGYMNFRTALQNFHGFLTKHDSVLTTDHILLKRLVFKFNSQLRHFKSFKYFKRVNQYMKKIPYVLQTVTDQVVLLKDCCSQQPAAVFLPSRQMLEYLLVKILELGLVLRKSVLFSMLTFNSSLTIVHRAELTGAHLLFCGLVSRIWVISRALILYLVDWYGELHCWLPHLKGTQANCLQEFTLPGELKDWLDVQCPVEDDPNAIEAKLPSDAKGVLARFMTEERTTLDSDDEVKVSGRMEENETGHGIRSDDMNDNDIGVAISRGGEAAPRKRKLVDIEDKKMLKKNRKAARHTTELSDSYASVDIGAPVRRKTDAVDSAKSRGDNKKKVKLRQKSHKAGKEKTRVSGKNIEKNSCSDLTSLSKSQFISEMKLKLKKPSKFMGDLKNNTLDLGGKNLALSRKKRDKIMRELTPVLAEFKSAKYEAAKLSGRNKTKKMKEMKTSRLNFKKTAKRLLWTVAQKS